MKDKELIDNSLFEWSDSLRVAGNEAAHGVGVAIAQEDAKDILEFTNAILLPGPFRAAQTAPLETGAAMTLPVERNEGRDESHPTGVHRKGCLTYSRRCRLSTLRSEDPPFRSNALNTKAADLHANSVHFWSRLNPTTSLMPRIAKTG